jgi:hypothetical protein
MPIKFSCIVVVFFFGCSENAPVSRRAPLPAEAMAAPARSDPAGPPPISPARAPEVDVKNPWAFYHRLDAWEAEIFKNVTFCLTPGVEDVMLSFASLHHQLERAKELERHDPARELSALQVYIRKSQERLERRMKRRGALGDGFHLSPYYFKPEMEKAVRLVSATFYEAVVPENSPRFFSLLYWPEGVETRLVEWEKGLIANMIGGIPPGPQVGKGWSQRFYLVPVILVVEIKRPRKFSDVQPALTKLAQGIDADLLSVRGRSDTRDTLEVQMMYHSEPEIAAAVRNVSIVRSHPLIQGAHIGAYQNQAIPIFWSPILKSSRKVEE